jgi:hypothetical protein
MARKARSKKAAVVKSPAVPVNAPPVHTTDLGNGKARLELDIEVPWATALQIIKIANDETSFADTQAWPTRRDIYDALEHVFGDRFTPDELERLTEAILSARR